MIRIAAIGSNPAERADYERFVARHPHARFAHGLGWADALHRTYGLRPEHLVARVAGQVVGILPLFYSRSLLVGRHYVSNPFPTYAGPLCDSPETLGALLGAVADKTRNVGYTLLNSGEELPRLEGGPQLLASADELTFLLPLTADPDELFSRMRKNIRRDVRHAARQGVEIEVDDIGDRQEEFYRLYATVYARKHGLPPHPRALFRNLWRAMPPGALRGYLARAGGRVVAAVLTIRHGTEVYYAWSASDAQASALQPTTATLWRIIADGCREGLGLFNMGEAPKEHEGLVRFKERWCPQRRQTWSYCLLGSADSPPPHYYGGFGWQKRLVASLPVPLTTRLISPLLRFVL